MTAAQSNDHAIGAHRGNPQLGCSECYADDGTPYPTLDDLDEDEDSSPMTDDLARAMYTAVWEHGPGWDELNNYLQQVWRRHADMWVARDMPDPVPQRTDTCPPPRIFENPDKCVHYHAAEAWVKLKGEAARQALVAREREEAALRAAYVAGCRDEDVTAQIKHDRQMRGLATRREDVVQRAHGMTGAMTELSRRLRFAESAGTLDRLSVEVLARAVHAIADGAKNWDAKLPDMA